MTAWGKLSLAAALSLIVAGTGSAGEAVVVTLRPDAAAPAQRVYVEDVARLEGGTLALRHRIARLDLADLPAEGTPVWVTKGQVLFRIQLAGIERARFRVEGPERVQVTLARHEVPEEEILAAAEQCIRQRLPGGPEEVTIRVARSVAAPVIVQATHDAVRLDAETRIAGLPLGRVQVEVGVYVNGVKRRSIPVQLDVSMRQNVAVASRAIPPGEVLSAANLHLEKRTVSGLNQFVTSAETVLGKKAKQPLTRGQIIALRDVEAEPPKNPVLIKQRDRVRLIAQLGSHQVIAQGEALQDGREGQLIRVRNTASQKNVLGRVVGRGMVEVEF